MGLLHSVRHLLRIFTRDIFLFIKRNPSSHSSVFNVHSREFCFLIAVKPCFDGIILHSPLTESLAPLIMTLKKRNMHN